MHPVYAGECPVAEVRDGMVFITIGGGNHPQVAAPLYIVRRFCEITIRAVDTWEREQALRGVVVKLDGRGAH